MKLKTNSSCKKRFRFTKSGKVVYKKSGKRHNMRKRSKKQIRCLRKSGILSSSHDNLINNMMPYN